MACGSRSGSACRRLRIGKRGTYIHHIQDETDSLVHVYRAHDELIVITIEAGMAPNANRPAALVADLVASVRDSIAS